MALVALALLPVGQGGSLDAQQSLGGEEHARLLLRALHFDRRIADRGAVRVAVLYGSDPAEAEPMRRAFEDEGASGVRGLPVSAISIRFENGADLLEAFAEHGVTAVYVPESLSGALSTIQQVTRARAVASLGEGRRMVERGISIGVDSSRTGHKMIVNLRSSQVEGLRLSSELLKLAELIR